MRKIAGVNFGLDMLGLELVESGLTAKKTVKSEGLALPVAKEERADFISGALTRWKKEYGPDGAVIGLPLQRFSHQLIEMPAMKRNDLKKALMFELEKYLPLPVDEYLFDFVTGPVEAGRTKALVLSIRKEAVREATNMATAAGIPVLSVRCSALIALRSLLDLSGQKSVSGLFVNATGSGYEVVGMKNSIPLYLKGFPKGTDISRELERLTALYPGQVYFMGNIGQPAAERFGARKFQAVTPGALAFTAGGKQELMPEFLPEDLARTAADPYPWLIGGLAAASLVVFLLTGATAYYKEWNALRAVEAKRSAVHARAAGLLTERKKLDVLRDDRKTLRDFRGKSNLAIRALSELSGALPQEAWLINLSVDDKGKVEIEGFTGKTSAVITALEKAKVFTNVAFSAPILAREGEERFALRMEVEGR
ncbi:MAG: pilus assembly protein PilM [Nitrospiraceae bacterium]|nr:pilus assembly protein PilM [Nitrospiraceae bacterium]